MASKFESFWKIQDRRWNERKLAEERQKKVRLEKPSRKFLEKKYKDRLRYTKTENYNISYFSGPSFRGRYKQDASKYASFGFFHDLETNNKELALRRLTTRRWITRRLSEIDYVRFEPGRYTCSVDEDNYYDAGKKKSKGENPDFPVGIIWTPTTGWFYNARRTDDDGSGIAQ